MSFLANCEWDKCAMKVVATPSKDMKTCSCGCDKTMHLSCLIAHNRELTHMIQTHRAVKKKWH